MRPFLKLTLLLIGSFGANPQFSSDLRLVSSVQAQSSILLSEQQIQVLRARIAKDSKASLPLRLRLARHYQQAEMPDKVIDTLRPIADRLDVSGMRLLARAFSLKEDHLQEIRVLENLVLQVKTDYVSYTRLGQAYVKTRKLPEATENFQKAISANRRYRPAHEGLLVVLLKVGKRYEYRVALLDMLDIFGESAELLQRVCKAYYEDGFLDDARKICQAALSKSPKVADNHIYYGLTLEAAGNRARALAVVQKAANQYPRSELAQYTAADLHEKSKNFLAAYKYYRQGTEADESSARSWLGLARMAFDSKNYDESLQSFKKACQLDRPLTVQDFRSSATQLKLENNYDWKGKFDSEATRCRYLLK